MKKYLERAKVFKIPEAIEDKFNKMIMTIVTLGTSNFSYRE
jgi:hypothetical protein